MCKIRNEIRKMSLSVQKENSQCKTYDKYVILLDLITILLHCENFDEQIRKHYTKFPDIHKENRKIGRVQEGNAFTKD